MKNSNINTNRVRRCQAGELSPKGLRSVNCNKQSLLHPSHKPPALLYSTLLSSPLLYSPLLSSPLLSSPLLSSILLYSIPNRFSSLFFACRLSSFVVYTLSLSTNIPHRSHEPLYSSLLVLITLFSLLSTVECHAAT